MQKRLRNGRGTWAYGRFNQVGLTSELKQLLQLWISVLCRLSPAGCSMHDTAKLPGLHSHARSHVATLNVCGACGLRRPEA